MQGEDMMIREVPRLEKRLQPRSSRNGASQRVKITHLIFYTTSGIVLPGVDYELILLLVLDPCVKRYMMYHQGCFAGGTVLRLAKDLAKNNKDAHVLIVCSENTAVTFCGPSKTDMDSLVGLSGFIPLQAEYVSKVAAFFATAGIFDYERFRY
ncbi:hypothetical protein Ahy_Scaffold6g107968 [Arachis hypogaea]|uniref:Chalcone/stilbene synthase N-terminal domain-containing protein n=1 Tax=Arachis hypogaea TaxID=3818 RepID=A0A444WPL8_ARAHY|nr:hypothetical protein Ahy_Scaffold6g107968 [Arachis hypogaea]